MEESGEVKAERLQWDDVRGRTFCLLIGCSLAPVPLLQRSPSRLRSLSCSPLCLYSSTHA